MERLKRIKYAMLYLDYNMSLCVTNGNIKGWNILVTVFFSAKSMFVGVFFAAMAKSNLDASFWIMLLIVNTFLYLGYKLAVSSKNDKDIHDYMFLSQKKRIRLGLLNLFLYLFVFPGLWLLVI